MGSQIMSVRFDLSTSLLPDVGFDPNGGAGDNVAKDVTVDSDSGVGFATVVTFDQPRDGGFDIVLLEFGEFETGETGFQLTVIQQALKGIITGAKQIGRRIRSGDVRRDGNSQSS